MPVDFGACMELCCLCKISLSTKEGKKRRKKLHGQACWKARGALNALLEDELGLGIESFQDTASERSFLCKDCGVKLGRIIDLQEAVRANIANFKPLEAGGAVETSGGKRTASSASAASSPPKRMRLDAAMSPISQSTSPALTA